MDSHSGRMDEIRRAQAVVVPGRRPTDRDDHSRGRSPPTSHIVAQSTQAVPQVRTRPTTTSQVTIFPPRQEPFRPVYAARIPVSQRRAPRASRTPYQRTDLYGPASRESDSAPCPHCKSRSTSSGRSRPSTEFRSSRGHANPILPPSDPTTDAALPRSTSRRFERPASRHNVLPRPQAMEEACNGRSDYPQPPGNACCRSDRSIGASGRPRHAHQPSESSQSQAHPSLSGSDTSLKDLPPLPLHVDPQPSIRSGSRASWRQSIRRSWGLGQFDFESASTNRNTNFPRFSQFRLSGIDWEHDSYDQQLERPTLSRINSASSGYRQAEEGTYSWPWSDVTAPHLSTSSSGKSLETEKTGIKGPQGPQEAHKILVSAADPKPAPLHKTDPNIVFWDGEADRENPMNWPMGKKKITIIALALFTFITPLASSMFAPAVPQLLVEFGIVSRLLSQFVVSVYVFGFAIGPLIVSPMSEIYGRYPVYVVGYVGFIAFNIGCALATSMPMLIVFRFFAGCFGVTPVAIGGGTIADLFPKEQRGKFMGLWALGPMLGPIVGPVGGGYLAAALGWRWVFWIITIISGTLFIISTAFTGETFAPVLLARKAARLRRKTGNSSLRSKLDNGQPASTAFWRAVQRPTHMFLRSPIVAAMSIYVSFVYGILYVLFTTFTFVFVENYGWSPQQSGLVYIGLGIGTIGGLVILGATSDKLCKFLANKYNAGVLKPEYRLPPLMYGGVTIPLGLFLYGWATQFTLFWPVPLAGTVLVGLGIIQVFICVQGYLVDAFGMHAASAMSVNIVLRSITAAFLPMAGLDMYDALGLGWGNSLLGFAACLLVPLPAIFYVYGERVRTNPKYKIRL